MLLFKGENFQPAAKGQEFTVLKHDTAAHRVFVSYLKDDDSLVAVSLPAEVLEPAPPNAWTDLVKGAQAFRDQRQPEAARLFQRAAQDATIKPLAISIAARVAAGAPAMRELTAQLVKSGLPSLAFPLDEGTDRLASAPPTKLDRADLTKRVTASQNAFMHARQSLARHRLIEASKHLETGLAAEPGHLTMKALDVRNKRDLDDAQGMLEDAEKMRRFQKGAVHAMTAIENGLKLCADHIQLRALKQEMNAQFEERTSPPVTPAFLAAMKAFWETVTRFARSARSSLVGGAEARRSVPSSSGSASEGSPAVASCAVSSRRAGAPAAVRAAMEVASVLIAASCAARWKRRAASGWR